MREAEALALGEGGARDQAEGTTEEAVGDGAASSEDRVTREVADALQPRTPLGLRAAGHRGKRGGREDDDEERREDAADRRQHDQDRRARGLLLGPLAALESQLLG